MSGSARNGWASSDDYTFVCLVIILAGLGFGAWLLWTNYHAEVSEAVARLQLAKLAFIRHFTDGYEPLADMVRRARYDRVTLAELTMLCDRVGTFFRVPAAVLLTGLAGLCLLWAPPVRYRRRLDLLGLMREQARSFRAAGAGLGHQLGLVEIREGAPRPGDPALHVHEWVERNAAAEDGGLNERLARVALAAQLGPVWQGARRATPAGKVLFVAFALHLDGRREEAIGLLGDLAEAVSGQGGHGPAGPEKPLTVPASLEATAEGFLTQGRFAQPGEAIAGRHGFETTALMSLLTAARLASGVLAPAQFNGIKLIDRGLWYALHSLGFPGDGPGQNSHPNPRVEAIGARAHWEAERDAQAAVYRPELDAAVHAVRAALQQHQVETKERQS